MSIIIRKALPEDRQRVIWVESQSTPGLRYVERVWDMFISDPCGDWSVAEVGGEVAGCGKYTILPDGSAWLETLRVIPQRQRLGIGRKLYEHWMALARRQGVPSVGMYTGLTNVASKTLAEKFGLSIAAVYRESVLPVPAETPPLAPQFAQVSDADEAVTLLMPLSEKWSRHMVMNRTFYSFTPELCRHLARSGMVYAERAGGSVVTLGARFMAQDALHIGAMHGDMRRCLDFAMDTAAARKVGRLNILYPPTAGDVLQALANYGFQNKSGDLIVMEVKLNASAM